MRWRSLLAGLLVLAGCRRAPEVPLRWEVARRLADVLALADGRGVPDSAVIGFTTRYVLAGVPRGLVHVDAAAAATKPGETVLHCPPSLAGRRVILGLPRELGGGVGEMRCSAGTAAPPATPDDEAGTAVHGEPARRVEVPAFDVPEGAVLRAGIGLADPRRREQRVAVRFTVIAEDEGGRAVTVFSRNLDPAASAADADWVDVEVSLAPALGELGKRVRLVFEAAPVGASDALVFPVWADPTIWTPTRTVWPPERRNVVLVSLDTLRADRLGCYGLLDTNSPNLDRIAAEGTLFENAVAQSPWTLPSHASMFTGVYGCVHRMGMGENRRRDADSARLMANYIDDRLPPAITPLAELLRVHGYETTAFSEDAYVSAAAFGRGFGLFRANSSEPFHDPGGNVEDTFAHGRAWLERHASEPFFLFLHTYQVHFPYTPPPPYYDLLAPLPSARASRARTTRAAGERALYDGEIRYTDAVLASLLPTLAALGLDRRTIVIVTSDHGEAFFEHGRFQHPNSLYAEETHVPFIWWAPGLAAPGRRISIPVGLIDIAPTVLDLLGLSPPPWMQGQSLAPMLRAGDPPVTAALGRVVYSQMMLGQDYPLGIRGLTWKSIVTPGQSTRTFFVYRDFQEQRPLRTSAVERMASPWRKRFEDDCARVRGLLAAAAGPKPVEPLPDPAQQQKLRALGYVE